ncbi:hypothetical protein [Calothrix sp. FACHB-168]
MASSLSSYQPFVGKFYGWSTVNGQRSTVNGQQSTVNSQLTTDN